MRFYAKSPVLFLLLCLAAVPVGFAQEQGKQEQEQEKEKREKSDVAHRVTREDPDLQHPPLAAQSLTMGERLEILSAALDSRRHADYPSDCSHFVHRLYERAGFPYGYASSSDLYAGIAEFRRVASPQPGDLAVWRGHTGIVVNPAQHSFFSLLSSGPGVDSYDSQYWKQRGRPRFFRYFKPIPSGMRSSSIRPANLRPTVSGNTERFQPDRRP